MLTGNAKAQPQNGSEQIGGLADAGIANQHLFAGLKWNMSLLRVNMDPAARPNKLWRYFIAVLCFRAHLLPWQCVRVVYTKKRSILLPWHSSLTFFKTQLKHFLRPRGSKRGAILKNEFLSWYWGWVPFPESEFFCHATSLSKNIYPFCQFSMGLKFVRLLLGEMSWYQGIFSLFEVDSNPNTMTGLSLYCRLNCHGIEDELGEMYWVVQRIKST